VKIVRRNVLPLAKMVFVVTYMAVVVMGASQDIMEISLNKVINFNCFIMQVCRYFDISYIAHVLNMSKSFA
jgi:hypothetical protein